MPDDLFVPHLKLVFCGTAAGRRSAARHAYYAGASNKFWRTLSAVGLTPRQLEPTEFRELLQFGIGLTDLVQDQAGVDRDILFPDAVGDRLRNRIRLFQPACMAFNGKKAAELFLATRHIDYGLQPTRAGDTDIFCVPSTSGLAARYWDQAPWRALALHVQSRMNSREHR